LAPYPNVRELTRVTPGFRGPGRTERVTGLAERQGGVVSRAQLLALGLSDSAISRWTAAGRIHRLLPTVYAVGHRAVCLEGRLRAALLYTGDGAVLSHLTAASWWGLVDDPPGWVHVSDGGGRRSIAGVVVHHPREVERTVHRDLPVTTVPRTLLDIASMVSFGRLRRALAQAEYLGLADLDHIASVTGRGRVGSRALRRALAFHQPQRARTLSELEERFLNLCERHGIPLPEVNVTIRGLMVDALWREERVIVELDGRAAHGTAAAIERDHGRDLTLRAAGYLVLRYTWAQVTRGAGLVATDVRTALASN